jgi:hypothetical protein
MQGARRFVVIGMGLVLMMLANSWPEARAQNAPAQQTTPAPAGPVPAQIAAAKSVFIANGGADAASIRRLKECKQERDEAYDEFYAGMKTAGQYSLVSGPADADLVLEIRFTSPIYGCGGGSCTDAPQFTLTIVDAKTHFTLWTLTEPVEEANRISTEKKNFSTAMAALVKDVKDIGGTGAQQ